MESIFRAAFIYICLMIVLRIIGHRTLNEMTTFDFVLLLIIGDSTQQAITGADYSTTNAFIIIITLVLLDVVMSYLKQKFTLFEKIIDGMPLILINDGKVQNTTLEKVQIDIADILEAGRKEGLENLEQIKYAILEKNGDITVIAHGK